MIIQCEKCKTRFRLDDSRITPSGVRVRCSRCDHTFVVRREVSEEDTDFDALFDGLGGMASSEDSQEEAASTGDGFSGENPKKPLPSQEEKEDEDAASSDDSWLDFDFSDEPTASTAGVSERESEAIESPAEGESEETEPSQGKEPEQPFSAFLRKGVGLPQFQMSLKTEVDENVADAKTSEERSDQFEFFSDDSVQDTSSSETTEEPRFTFQADNTVNASSDLQSSEEVALSLPDQERIFPAADSKEEEPADEEPPPLSIASRRKSSSFIPMALSVFLLLVLGGVAFFLFSGSGGHAGLLPESLRTMLGLGKNRENTVVIRLLEGSFVNNKDVGEIFVMKGEVLNASPKPVTTIRVKGKIWGPRNDVLMQRTVFCGNVLSAGDLAFQPFSSMEKSMSRQFGSTLSNFDVGPGKKVPFVIVFKNVPAGATHFGAEVVGSAGGKRP